MKIGYKALIEEARTRIEEISAEDAVKLRERPDVVIVDVRDIRELEREGRIPGSFHCPRGMLEFWIDPESPYHKPVFAEAKQFIFHCSLGWRSALSADTAKRMGLPNAVHIEGGFEAWKKAGGAVEPVTKKL